MFKLKPRIPNPIGLTAIEYLNQVEDFVNYFAKNPKKILKEKNYLKISKCFETFLGETNPLEEIYLKNIPLRNKSFDLRSRLSTLCIQATPDRFKGNLPTKFCVRELKKNVS